LQPFKKEWGKSATYLPLFFRAEVAIRELTDPNFQSHVNFTHFFAKGPNPKVICWLHDDVYPNYQIAGTLK